MARRRGSGKISETRWAGFSFAFFSQAAGSIAAQLSSASATTRETILRTRGNLVAWVDATGAPARACDISVGIRLVPAGTGTTVLTDPFGEAAAPWFWYEEFVLGYEEMVTDVVDVSGITSFRAVIDSKAMRIWRPETEIQLVMTNTTLASATVVNLAVSGRFLIGD